MGRQYETVPQSVLSAASKNVAEQIFLDIRRQKKILEKRMLHGNLVRRCLIVVSLISCGFGGKISLCFECFMKNEWKRDNKKL